MRGKLKIAVCLGLLLISLSYSSQFAKAAYGPTAYITESVTSNYWWNGSYKDSYSKTGVVQVSLPNDWDVLQYVRVTLSGAKMFSDTNVVNTTAYDNVVTSYSTINSKDTIYVNTSASAQSSSYIINSTNTAPTINLSLTYTNYFGGTDIFDNDNTGPGGNTNVLVFNFSIRNPSSTDALNGVVAGLQFALAPAGTSNHDVVDIDEATDTTAGGGTTDVVDMDGDTDEDRINWTGDLAAGVTVYITFNASLRETVNIADGDNDESLDSNDKGAIGNYTNSATLTGLTVSSKLARGPVRQGVDLQLSADTWYARGLMKNMANSSVTCTGCQPLTYNITAWRIYTVNPVTGAPYASPNMTGEFNQSSTSYLLTTSGGTVYTNDLTRSSNTSWFNTTSSTKPYIASYWDWQVLWNDTVSNVYASYVNTTMDMQTVRKVDMINAHTLSGVVYPDTGNQAVTVNDTAYYTGSTSISVGNLTIYSIIPANTTSGLHHGTFILDSSTVKVYFFNASGCSAGCQLQGDANVNWTNKSVSSGGTSNGSVILKIRDLSSALMVSTGTALGSNLSAANSRIVLVYDVLSNVSMTTGDTYIFTGNTTFNTTSGTPETENHVYALKTIQVSAKRLIGYKDLFVPAPNTPTLINATLNVTVEGAGEYIEGIKFIDYVVNGTFGLGANNLSNYITNLSVQYCNATACYTWTNGTHYNVTHNGTRQLSDTTWVEVYEFTKAISPGTFNLSGGDYILVNYQMNISITGSYILPLQIAAFDPSTGQSFSAEAWGVITVEIPIPAIPLQITDHELELAKRVAVGIPAVWIKNFEVYNPNARSISSKFETTVFGDSMQGFASYYNERGEKVEEQVIFGNVEKGKKTMSWESSLAPFETRTYEIRVLTPPVMEIDRDIEVLDKLENKMVKLKMDVFLKSFAEEPYANLVLNLPIGYENILEVKDGFGRSMQFTGGKDTSSIILDQIEPMGMKTISVIYKASYPTIIITPDRDRYDLSSPVSLEILVINGGESIDYPFVEVEIYTPGMDVIYSNLERLKEMEPLEKTQTYQKFVIPMNAPGGMYIASAKFREDFTVLASTTGNFFVVGQGVSTPEALQIVAVLTVTAVLLYFSFRRLREVRRTKTLLEGPRPF